jgi:hypothetical protein
MELEVRAHEGTGTDLYRWLVSDPDVSATISPADASSGEMGLGFDILNLVIPNTLALGSLVTAIATYRTSRQQSTGIAPQVSVGHADTFVLVEGDGSNALEQLGQASEGTR